MEETMWLVLLGVGAVSFIGYLIWLIVCIRNWDSKIPPIIGMALSLVMVVGGLAGVPDVPDGEGKAPDDAGVKQEDLKDPAPEDTSDNDEGASDEEPSGDDQGIWYVDYYKDDFQQATDKWYITAPPFSGTYNSNAFTDEELTVEVLVDCEGEIAFLLYYGDILQTRYSFEDDPYNITMRTSDGVDYVMTGTMYSKNNHLCIDEEYKSTVLEFMQNGESISFYIESGYTPNVNYLFTITTDGFNSVYQSQISG